MLLREREAEVWRLKHQLLQQVRCLHRVQQVKDAQEDGQETDPAAPLSPNGDDAGSISRRLSSEEVGESAYTSQE
jgi:hypothetical protein